MNIIISNTEQLPAGYAVQFLFDTKLFVFEVEWSPGTPPATVRKQDFLQAYFKARDAFLCSVQAKTGLRIATVDVGRVS